jgi:hypothetical protein
VVRTALATGEPLELEVIAMGTRPVVARFFWRRLGAEQFQSQELKRVARGVFRVELASSQMGGDLEYYVELTADRQQLRFPATAPALNQTVVQIPIPN